MLLTILIVLALAVTLAMVATGLWQLRLVRLGRIPLSAYRKVELAELLQYKIDQWYHGFGFFFKQVVHLGYFYLLLAIRRVVIMVRYLLVRAERKSSRLIDSVRGKGVIHKKGAVSLFLAQIKEQK